MSVRCDRVAHVPAAYEAAARLRAGGLDWVLAPLAGRSGRVVHSAGGRPVVVFPWLEGREPVPAEATPEQASAVVGMVERLHRTAVEVPLPGSRSP